SGSITGTGTLTADLYDLRSGVASVRLAGGGGGGAIKFGAGTVLLTGTNTFTGGVAVNEGILSISKAAALGDAGNTVTLAGGTLNATQSMTLAYPMAVTAPGSALSADAGKRMVVTGAVSGAEGLQKTGDGTVYLMNTASTFGGAGKAVTLADGILAIGKNQVLGDAANKIVLDGGTLAVLFGPALNAQPQNLIPYPGSRDIEVAAGGGTLYVAQGRKYQTSSALSGDGDLVKTGGGEWYLGGGDTSGFTGDLTMAYSIGNTVISVPYTASRSQIRLKNSGALMNLASLTIETASIFHLDNDGGVSGNRFSDTAPIIMKGGEFRLQGRNAANQYVTETVGVVTLDSRHSLITSRRAQGSSSTTLTLSGLTRNTGATVTFSNDGQGTFGQAGFNSRIIITGYTTGNLNDGIMGGWALLSTTTGSYITTPNDTAGIAFAGYDNTNGIQRVTSTPSTNLNTAAPNANVIVSSAQALATNVTVNSLIASGNINLTLTGYKLTIDTGGFIKTNNSNNTVTGGTLTAGSGGNAELFLHLPFAAANSLTISSEIADNGAGKVALVKGGSGRLILSGANTYTGGTFVNGNGAVETGATNSVTYLGRGPVTLRQGTWLDLRATGAAADPLNAGKSVYNIQDCAELVLYATPDANEVYNFGPNSALLVKSGVANLAGLTWGANLNVQTGAVLTEEQATQGVLDTITGLNLVTTPTAYY
ncbi:MAG: hypothetical protein FJ288_19785, partial [Planctomycetes bacterium]|nr:hypothetical protein [Planctomycetota bacterium]